MNHSVVLPPTSDRQQKGYDYLQTLYVVADMLRQAEADGLDIDVVLPRVLTVAMVELDARLGSIIVADPTGRVEHAWSVEGGVGHDIRRDACLPQILRHGAAGLAMQTLQSVVVADTLSDARWSRLSDHPTATAAWSAVCVPIIVRRQAIGVLTLAKPGIGQFDQDAVNLLNAIAATAGNTIHNARLYAAMQRQLAEAELFNRAAQALNSTLDLQAVMQTMVAQLNVLLHAAAVSVALVEGDELVYSVAAGVGAERIVGLRLPIGSGLTGWVLRHMEPVRVADAPRDPRFDPGGDARTGVTTRALICAPLHAQGRAVGTLQAINPTGDGFTDDDLRVLVRLANLAGSAVANAEQFRQARTAEARYLTLFEDSIDAIILTDADGKIRELNRAAQTLLERPRNTLIGRSIDALHSTPLSAAVNAAPAQDEAVVQILKRHVHTQSGRRIPVEIHVKALAGPDRGARQWIYHDISEQVALEQMRNDVTAMLFHDLQNPLSNIIGSLELLEMDLGEDADPVMRTMVTVASRSSQRLRHLIRSLLDVNQLEAGAPIHERAPTELDPILHYVADMMDAYIERKQIALVFETAEDLPPVDVNRDMIERVLINLCDNAVKFSRPGDRITAAAELDAQPGYVRITVSDQGPGIPAAFRPLIFEKFYRVPGNTGKGIGLGLAFCRLAVEAHGGRIWVEEAPPPPGRAVGGARFGFTLPIARATLHS